VGLIQRVIELRRIPTIGITLQQEVTMKVKPPRALFLRYPFGHPLGEAFHVRQQRTILINTLTGLETIQEPGTILTPGYVWRRHAFD
jgi:D-proline reductase (dithiol) PrdB